MLLGKLAEYSERLPCPPPSLYGEGPVRYLIDLDQEGRFLSKVDLSDSSSPRTRRGQRRLLPQVQRSSGIRPLLMADKADYTLGYAADERRAGRARDCHRAYVELVERCAAATGEPDVRAVLMFLHNDPLGRVQPDEDFDPSGIITFRVQDRVTVDNPAVRTFWASANAPGGADAPTMQCLVCGNDRPVLDRLQAKIKGIPGGQTAGTSLISANSDAFESYGLSASLNAPTCANCGEAFTRGINSLLAGGESRLALGGGVFVFWTRDKIEFNFLSTIDDPDPSQVQALLETVRTGRWTGVDEGPFYALSLSASGGRAVVRDWLDTTVGNAKQHLAAWFRRQRIASWSEEMPRYYGLRALAFATVREPRDLPRTTLRVLMRAALTGAPLPMGILHQAVRRNQAERDVTRARAALIKLALLSQNNDYPEDCMVQLDLNNTEPGYRCGRLLAVLERAQGRAIKNLNTTIVDRFYGTASTAPGSAFSHLMKGAQAHLSTLKRDNRGAHNAIQAQLEEVMSGLDTFPKTLTPEQQGLFALGYYHQKAQDRAQARERSQARKEPEPEPEAETENETE